MFLTLLVCEQRCYQGSSTKYNLKGSKNIGSYIHLNYNNPEPEILTVTSTKMRDIW